ncbi:MAG TPA: hypothetical protein VFG35_26970 [Actinoplanes sp.]|nr:hypothetical protein [Actinoplanes sp.]
MQPASLGMTLRRTAAKLVLVLAGCWVLFLVAGVITAAGGSSDIPWINWVSILFPGFALVPAGYYGIKLLRSSDPDVIRALWPKCAVYGVIGVVLGVVTVVALNMIQNANG